jgi:hypothetical protein
MAPNTDNSRPWWVVPLVVFVVGLLIGWWGIGWGLWPVEWKNALPPDLRPTERDAYLLMTAESFAQNRDLKLAQERLSTWSPDDLAQDLPALQMRLAGTNLQGAAQVQNLMAALNLRPAQPVAPTATPQVAAAGDLMTQLRRICTLGLWVLLFLGGVVVAVLLYRRWRAAHAAQGGPAIDEAVLRAGAGERTPAQIAEEAKRAWPGAPRAEAQPPLSAMEWPEVAPEEGEESGLPDFRITEEPSRPPQAREPESRATAAPPRAAEPTRRPPALGAVPSAGPSVKLGEWRAIYRMGESDYSEAFDINDTDGAYVGYCAMDLMKPVGRGHDQAAALEVSLWDSNDPDTRVAAVMSEGAYRDTATRDQLAGPDQAIAVAKPNAEITLETYKLLLRGTVERVAYAEGELPNSVFAELAVRLAVYRKA